MGNTDRRADEAITWRGRREAERLHLECRECEVICERVIYPWQCLRSKCECIYSYEDEDTMYFGCLHKVFAPELDLAAFSERATLSEGPGFSKGAALSEGAEEGAAKRPTTASSPTRQAGVARGKRSRVKGTDPYGPIRVTRMPRGQCEVRVEHAYDTVSPHNCCNPTFFHHPSSPAEDAMRLTAKCPDEGNLGPGDDAGARK